MYPELRRTRGFLYVFNSLGSLSSGCWAAVLFLARFLVLQQLEVPASSGVLPLISGSRFPLVLVIRIGRVSLRVILTVVTGL